MSLVKPIKNLTLAGNSRTIEQLQAGFKDVINAAHIENHTIVPDPDLGDDQFMITQMDLEQ